MPVTVQLPGYNRAAPAVGIADVLNAGANIYKDVNQGNLQSEQTKNETLKNQALQSENTNNLAYQKALSDPASPQSQSALNDLVANISIHKEAGKKLGFSDQTLQPFDQLLDAAKNGYQAGTKPLPAGQEGPQEVIRQPMSGLDAVRAKDSPLFKGIEQMYEAKLKGDATMGAANLRVQPQNDRNANQVSSQYSHDFGPMDWTIQAANRVSGIIKRIQSGELKSTPTLTTDLSNALGQMFNNGKAATVSGSEHAVAGMTSLEGNASSKYGYVSGQPMNTVTPQQLSQLGADVNALRGEYVGARKNAFDSWIEGIPQSERAGLTARFNKFSSTSAAPAPENTGSAAPIDPAKMTREQKIKFLKGG